MPYPLPLTRTEAYLAYKAGVIQQSDLKPSLAVPRNGIDAWLAYWTGLAADYPKREDGTPHILQEEEAYIAYLCGVINEYPEKCLRRVGAYLRYIISARWGRPDHPLNREELYLSLIKTQFIPSGDPSSDIVIDGTAKAPFVDVKMYGDTFQQTYTGKNLFDDNTATDAYIQSNGAVTPNSAWRSSQLIKVKPNTSYTWHGDVYGVHQVVWAGYNSSQAFISGQYAQVNNVDSLRIITGENTEYIRVGYRSDGMRNMQLELGSTASDYEPYVGGQPSPSPEYPQQIQTVTGRQVVSVTGKNLFDIGSSINDYFASDADGGRIYTNPNNMSFVEANFAGSSFTVASYNTAGWRWMSKWVELSKNTDYRISTSKATGAIKVVGFNSKEAGTGGTVLSTLSDEQTFNSGDYEFYAVSIYPHSAGATFSNIQIELGSTATQFVPYSKHTYPLDLGSIELCKLGTYQDYIWKDGEDWKVHKATAIASASNREWEWANISPNGWYFSHTVYGYYDINKINVISKSFIGVKRSVAPNTSGTFITMAGDGSIGIRNPNMTGSSNVTQFTNWLNSLNTTWLYALTTPTDTTITDQTLIAQLDALLNGGAEDGTTYIKVNATDPNLPGLLYVEAPKYE